MSRSRGVQRCSLISLSILIFAGMVVVVFQSISSAFELNHAEISEDKGIFQLKFTTTIDAPADYVRQVLTDFTYIYRLNPSIIESEILPSKRSGETKVRTKVLACASVFCREVERVEIVRILASGDLQVDIVPEQSDFRSGKAIWKITAFDNRSKLEYEATVEPDFFIPPVIGISVIGTSMKDEVIRSFDRIEHIASINASRDRTDDFTIAGFDVSATGTPCD